ncbi:MAG: hypothetical protein WC796_04110 [Candidatus Pacearchaeota archaeon]|jgi:hypothetical protein
MKRENIKLIVAITLLLIGVVLVFSQATIQHEAMKILYKGSGASISSVKVLQVLFDETYFRRILMGQMKTVVGWFDINLLLQKIPYA